MSGSTSNDPVGIGDAGELRHAHIGTADASTVAVFRHSFGEWLDGHLELDEERVADIMLAINEAMSNCADHAYRVADQAGAMTLQTAYFPATNELKVCVVDRGRWLEPDFDASCVRGRGIVLMRALADDCAIDGDGDGTIVCLRFYGCPPKSFVLSQAS